MNCSSDLKIFANSWPSSSNFKGFSRSLEYFFLTVCQNNFETKYHGFFFLPCMHAVMKMATMSSFLAPHSIHEAKESTLLMWPIVKLYLSISKQAVFAKWQGIRETNRLDIRGLS